MWIRVTLIALLSLLLASGTRAQTGGLELALLSTDPAEIGSRFPASITISVHNTSGSDQLIKAEALAGEGWGVVVLPAEFDLASGASQTVFITVSAPTTQAAGTYEIATRFTPRDAGLPAVELPVGVRINPVENLSILSTSGETGLLSSTEPVTLGYQLVNLGNTTTTATLVVDVSPQWEYLVDTASAAMSPGNKTDIVVELIPPANMSFVTTVRLSLKVVTAATSEESPAARINTTFNVRPGESPDLGSTDAVLDGEVTTRLDYRDDSTLAIQSFGTLAGELGGGRYAALEVTTPSWSSTESGYSRDSQFSAKYLDPAWGFIEFGDITINLNSQLLLSSIGGYGALVGFTGADVGGRLSYSDRAGYRQEQNTAAQLILGQPQISYVQITAVNRNSCVSVVSDMAGPDATMSGNAAQPSQFGDADSVVLYSVLGHAAPMNGLTVEAEAATSDNASTGSGQAYMLESRWYQPGFSVGGRLIRGDRTFAGAWSDTVYQDWNAVFKLAPEIRLWGNLNTQRRNVDDDPGYSAILRERLRFGTDLSLGNDTNLRVSLEENTARDKIMLSTDSKETSTAIDLTQRWDKARFAVRTEFGRKQDNLDQTATNQRQYAIRGNFEIGNNDQLNLAYTMRKEDSDAGESSNSQDISVGTSIELDDHSDLHLNLRWYDSSQSDNEQLSANTLYRSRLSNGHELQLRSQHSFGSFDDTTNVALDYVIPLSVPLSGFALRASVTGRVFLGSDPQRGIPETMIMIDGHTVITDETGAFAFPALEPGLHTLQISAMSLAMGVSADPRQLTISIDGSAHSPGADFGYGLIIPEVVEGAAPPPPGEREIDQEAAPGWPVYFRTATGQEIVIELPVKTGASISGTVYEQDAAMPGHQGQAHLLAGAVIELTGPDTSKYRISDGAGRFRFTGLAPGAYQVSVRTERLAEYHVAEPAQVVLDVAEGALITDITFTVRQAERSLEITEF